MFKRLAEFLARRRNDKNLDKYIEQKGKELFVEQSRASLEDIQRKRQQRKLYRKIHSRKSQDYIV